MADRQMHAQKTIIPQTILPLFNKPIKHMSLLSMSEWDEFNVLLDTYLCQVCYV